MANGGNGSVNRKPDPIAEALAERFLPAFSRTGSSRIGLPAELALEKLRDRKMRGTARKQMLYLRALADTGLHSEARRAAKIVKTTRSYWLLTNLYGYKDREKMVLDAFRDTEVRDAIVRHMRAGSLRAAEFLMTYELMIAKARVQQGEGTAEDAAQMAAEFARAYNQLGGFCPQLPPEAEVIDVTPEESRQAEGSA